MKKFNIPTKPELKYSDKTTKMLSLRLPEKLLKRLRKEAKVKNYSMTELATMVLDQYLQQSDDQSK